jgi:hypothetical protein
MGKSRFIQNDKVVFFKHVQIGFFKLNLVKKTNNSTGEKT